MDAPERAFLRARPWVVAWLYVLPWALLRAGSLAESDTFWEFRIGVWMTSHQAIPRLDPFSWTAGGEPWRLNSWGFDVLAGLVYLAGGLPGVALLTAAMTREPGPRGPAGPAGLPGQRGPRGVSGPAWLYQPSPGQLLGRVVGAGLDVSSRTLLDPREGMRYWMTLLSSVVKFQGGLLLRAIVTTDLPIEVTEEEDDEPGNLRSIV